jgi:hypothetical protein
MQSLSFSFLGNIFHGSYFPFLVFVMFVHYSHFKTEQIFIIGIYGYKYERETIKDMKG